MTLENGDKVLGTIDRLKAKEKNGALTKDEQIELHHNENILARTQVTNLEAKQKALSKLATPRDLHSTELAALAKAKAMLARPWPGTAPATTTQSSSGSLPPGDTSTTHGVTPPTGSSTATSSHAGTGNTTGTTATGSTTSTASSGDSIAPGSGTHTTNGVAAPPVGHGNRIPEDTTHPEHIDLATRRAENLGKIAAKRKLNPHEQDIYDNALRVRHRNAPAQPGDRNSPLPEGSRDTANPNDLAMSGDEDALVPVTPDGEDAHLDAAADTPPASANAQPANAIGKPINGPSTANPDAPTATAAPPTPSPPAGPAGAPQTAGTSSPVPSNPPHGNPPTTTTATSVPAAPPASSNGGTASTANSGPSPSAPSPATPVAPYPPIDHDHVIKAEFNKKGKATGGHSLLNGDVRIVPGTELPPNAHGVYQAGVEMKKKDGTWVAKKSNKSINTMFPKDWTAEQIRAEVQGAWESPHKVIDAVDNSWSSVSPAGVKIEGYIDTTNNRITAYPLY
ncbi:MAG: EndoU domain-containing protein [Prosthecobacter sp.]